MSAILSACEKYRYRLERKVQDTGKVIAFFGINPSTADAQIDDQTVKKWIGFTRINGGARFIVGNVFAYRATDVKELREIENAVGDDNFSHIQSIIAAADILVPCWGSRDKVPKKLRDQIDKTLEILLQSGKPVKVLGITKSGDPIHPLTLAYETPLIDYAIAKEES